MKNPEQDQNKLLRTRRTLRLLTSFNPTLFRVQDEHELFTESCRRIVEIGDYLMAWVGFAQQDENRSILPVASFGHEEGYLENLSITWKDNDLGRGPLGTAIRTGVTQISRNLLPEPSLVLRHKAPNRCQSSISLPLADNNKIFGALTIYAPEPDAFNPDEAKLLEVLASDLVIKMINIRSLSKVEELRSESRIAREALQSIELRFSLILDVLNEGVTLLDETFRIALVNRSLCHMLDYRPEEMLGHHLDEFAFDEDKNKLRKQFEVLLKGDNSAIECQFRRKDGDALWLISTGTVFKDEQGALEGVIALFTDVTESKQIQREMQIMKASFESLGESFCRETKDAEIYEGEDSSGVFGELPNRRLFLDRLEQGTKKSQRTRSPLALLNINLGLGNDVNGPVKAEGNDLLVEAARRIMKCVRETDTVAYLGRDEFTMVLPEFGKRIHLERITRDIIRALTQPYDLSTSERSSVSASIGIAIYPDDSGSIEELMSHASQAMRAAKEEGDNHFNYFIPSMQKEAQEKLALTNDLREALARNELEIYFQPIVDSSEERITKAEALLRWKHPKRGMVSPVIFIPLAEESRLILEIGDWVFEEVITSIDRWYKQFGRIVQVCVNKSLVQFEEISINPWMDRLVSTGLPANSVTVGITEGLFINDSAKVKQRLLDFRSVGIEVSIDDFGTGFSALSYLKEFDINYIKINLSLVSDLIENGKNKALTEAIIVMAHKLGIKTIAEGVETESQRDLLRAFGCDYLQGYLYSRPVSKDDFEKMLEK